VGGEVAHDGEAANRLGNLRADELALHGFFGQSARSDGATLYLEVPSLHEPAPQCPLDLGVRGHAGSSGMLLGDRPQPPAQDGGRGWRPLAGLRTTRDPHGGFRRLLLPLCLKWSGPHSAKRACERGLDPLTERDRDRDDRERPGEAPDEHDTNSSGSIERGL
jgi:hypothetical protein